MDYRGSTVLDEEKRMMIPLNLLVHDEDRARGIVGGWTETRRILCAACMRRGQRDSKLTMKSRTL